MVSQNPIRPVSILFIALSIPLREADKLIKRVKELYTDLEVQKNVHLIEPNYIILVSHLENSERGRLISSDNIKVFEKPLERKQLLRILSLVP